MEYSTTQKNDATASTSSTSLTDRKTTAPKADEPARDQTFKDSGDQSTASKGGQRTPTKTGNGKTDGGTKMTEVDSDKTSEDESAKVRAKEATEDQGADVGYG